MPAAWMPRYKIQQRADPPKLFIPESIKGRHLEQLLRQLQAEHAGSAALAAQAVALEVGPHAESVGNHRRHAGQGHEGVGRGDQDVHLQECARMIVMISATEGYRSQDWIVLPGLQSPDDGTRKAVLKRELQLRSSVGFKCSSHHHILLP